MLLQGSTSTRLQVWDAVRSLDYLAAHPQVDPKRLASTGQSGGGTLTMLLLAVDDRLAAAAVASGNTENVACANFNPPGSTDDAEQNLLGSGPLGFDRWDVLYPFAPKPLLISVSDKDFFGTYSSDYISSGWEEYQKLKKVYTAMGHGDHLAWADTPLPHGLSYDSRLQIYNWFGRYLKGDGSPVKEEPPVAPEPDKTLWVSGSGNVVKSFESETPFTLNRARASVGSRVSDAGDIARLLGVDRPAPDVRASVLRRAASRDAEIAAIEILAAAKVWVPAWLFTSRASDAARSVIVMLDPTGRNVRWHEGELYQNLAARGPAVCAVDLRGLGDAKPEFGRGDARYARSHQAEEDYAWASLILGKSLLGQRVTDILAIAAALRAHPGLTGRRLVIAALGKLTAPAIFAAALDSKIDALYLAGGLVSYRNLIETEDYTYPLANFAPNLLNHADLPELLATLAPRRVTLAGAVDAANRTLDPASVRKIYGAADSSGNLTILPRPQWDLETLSKWA
jgi:dienelactone hydrolase